MISSQESLTGLDFSKKIQFNELTEFKQTKLTNLLAGGKPAKSTEVGFHSLYIFLTFRLHLLL